MIKIIQEINIENILTEYMRLEPNMFWTEFGHKGKQTSIQYKVGEDPWNSSVGTSKGQEVMYCNLNPFFKDTVFEKLIIDLKFFRTRLMWVYPYACYSMHKDLTVRIHIPLITNPDCYFIFKKEIPKHLSVGNVYLVDTREEHTFINCSDKPRLHLVGLIKS